MSESDSLIYCCFFFCHCVKDCVEFCTNNGDYNNNNNKNNNNKNNNNNNITYEKYKNNINDNDQDTFINIKNDTPYTSM